MLLICGASGLVGKEMCNFLEQQNINYIGTYNKNKINRDNMFQIDFFNSILLEEFFIYHKITCCIFCIVERLTDVCENKWNEIKKTNIDLPRITSYICNKLNIKFIHLSTDYVFDGSTQPNLPYSHVNPLQNYGISKLISEHRIIANCTNYCIIRTPVLYSSLSKIHDNAVCLIGKNLMDKRTNKMFKEDDYSIRRPLYIPDLCKFIYDCCIKNYTGIYHFYNPYNKYTKYEICQQISNVLNVKIDKIIPNNKNCEDIAPRPYDTQLHDDKINILNYSFNNFNDTIIECFNKYKHPEITINNKEDLFIVLDMDGTIIDTNDAHFNSYNRIFEKYNKTFLNKDEWNNIIMNDNINNYLKNIFDEDFIKIIKQEKQQLLKYETISFTKNSEIFLSYLIDNNFNFCIVTNTSEETVNIFKEKLPLLNEIKQWIFRDHYNLPKPNDACYKLAKQKYFKNERYIIGFEDSMVGYNALKSLTDIIYIFNNQQIFEINDCYLIDDFMQLLPLK